jgi:magnesium-transporting ATPase (P-type)
MAQYLQAHAASIETCLQAVSSTTTGLTAPEAALRLAEHGPNRLPMERGRGPVLRFLVQFHNVLIYVLLGAAVVTGALQRWVDTGVILAVVMTNAVIGFLQEGKAEARWPRSAPCWPRAPPCCATGSG